MKNKLLILFIFVSAFSYSQTYTPYSMPNNGVIEHHEMIFEKGDSMIVLVNNSTSPPSVYVLENMTTATYVPPTLNPDWTTTILYKQHKTVYTFSVGGYYTVINDNNGYSYLRIH